MSLIVVKVYAIGKSGQKLVTIPKNSDICPEDYVKVEKVK